MVFFAVCIFISAFLLFQVEPMIGKYILPWFGGTPAVWSTVMLFFQIVLTGGYAYAYWLSGKARRREAIHLVLLGVSLVLMLILGWMWKSPITPGASLKPAGSSTPIGDIFKLLTISVGLPYFLLASNSPLIQAWFHRAYPGKTTYRLYAISNAGSLIALISYPVLIEPYLTLTWQGRIWCMGFSIYAILAFYGALKTMRAARVEDGGKPAANDPADKLPDVQKNARPGLKEYVLWIALSACASILLLATTSHITQEVAVIPFLWILPLTVYLLTFVLAFSGERWYSRQAYLILFFLATLLYGWALGRGPALSIPVQLAVFSLLLFLACMVCHGELYRLRPHPDHLTSFYLMVSVGGALGGMIINFVAPYVFKGYWELPLGIALCWLLFLSVTFVSKLAAPRRWIFVFNSILLLSAVLVSSVRAYQQVRADLTNDLLIQRNFYGVIRVRDLGTPGSALDRLALVHGVTVHGYQFLDRDKRDLPTSYFGTTSGGGLAILNHPKRGRGMRVGVLGLGIGTLAAYGQPGDVYRFYEINPLVIRLAEGEGGYFSYLSDSQARIEIVPGDARLSLEHELAAGQSQNYDVLVLDVFSSDSIPAHLLDVESFALYLQDLQPGGILAAHISNRHLDLVPVVWSLADHFGLSRALIEDPGNGPLTFPSNWMLLTRDPAVLNLPAIQSRAVPMSGYTTTTRLWTDDYSNLFQILKY